MVFPAPNGDRTHLQWSLVLAHLSEAVERIELRTADKNIYHQLPQGLAGLDPSLSIKLVHVW